MYMLPRVTSKFTVRFSIISESEKPPPSQHAYKFSDEKQPLGYVDSFASNREKFFLVMRRDYVIDGSPSGRAEK